MSSPSVIIVGGGLAGLTAACYARMNGLDTTLFESHVVPGGYATMYQRKGYTFDCAMDWLNGVNPAEKDGVIWRELGYLEGRAVAYFDRVLSVRDREGRTTTFWADPDRLEAELLGLTRFDEDRKEVSRLCRDIRALIRAPSIEFTKPDTLMSTWEMLRMAARFLPYLRSMAEYSAVLTRDYADRFRDPRLREVMKYFYFDPAMPQSVFTAVYQIVAMNKRTLGYPQGGGHGLTEYLATLFTELGGRLHCRTPVEKILVRGGRAVGVRTRGGDEHQADDVITACDSRSVVYGMLGGEFVDAHVQRVFERGRAYPSLLRIYMGVARDFAGEPHSCAYLRDRPLDVPGAFEGREQRALLLRHFCAQDRTFAPPGKSVVNTVFFADFDHWKGLRESDRARYREAKKRLAEMVVREVETIHPGFASAVEHVDVVTPATYERYTGNHRGAIKAWIDDGTDISDLLKKVKMKLPGLDHLYMIGQWIVHGGMIRVAASGRHVVDTLCARLGRPFCTALPDGIGLRVSRALARGERASVPPVEAADGEAIAAGAQAS